MQGAKKLAKLEKMGVNFFLARCTAKMAVCDPPTPNSRGGTNSILAVHSRFFSVGSWHIFRRLFEGLDHQVLGGPGGSYPPHPFLLVKPFCF